MTSSPNAAPISDESGKTGGTVAAGNVKVQVSLAPLKFKNGMGMLAPLKSNLIFKREVLDALTTDSPLVVSTFTLGGNTLPYGTKIFIGGKPSPELLAKLHKGTRRKKTTK
jgi:hypothetical protein